MIGWTGTGRVGEYKKVVEKKIGRVDASKASFWLQCELGYKQAGGNTRRWRVRGTKGSEGIEEGGGEKDEKEAEVCRIEGRCTSRRCVPVEGDDGALAVVVV